MKVTGTRKREGGGGVLSAADTAVEAELFSTDMNLSLNLFLCQSLYMKGFSCIPDREKSSLKRKLLIAVQKGMYISMARNTSVLMLIGQTICAYFYY